MAPAPAAIATQPIAVPPDSSVKPAKAAASATVTPAAAPVPQAVAPTPVAVPLLGELPQDLRGQIPKITLTGSVYSDSPAQRLLLINNLVLSQGSQVTPDLTLEEIQPRSSVFNFKGTRFRVMH
jgi:general secretion pathway protein B